QFPGSNTGGSVVEGPVGGTFPSQIVWLSPLGDGEALLDDVGCAGGATCDPSGRPSLQSGPAVGGAWAARNDGLCGADRTSERSAETPGLCLGNSSNGEPARFFQTDGQKRIYHFTPTGCASDGRCPFLQAALDGTCLCGRPLCAGLPR